MQTQSANCRAGELALIQIGDPRFREVLQLRSRTYSRSAAGIADDVDPHSLHCIYQREGRVVGALRVTCRAHGQLESEDAYPDWLLEEFGERLCAASRLCVDPESRSVGASVSFELAKFAWKKVLPLGVRIDVTKARLRAIPYHMKRGYHFVKGSLYHFDKWDAHCGLIAYSADSNSSGRLAEMFCDLDDPCCLQDSPNHDQFTASFREFTAHKCCLPK